MSLERNERPLTHCFSSFDDFDEMNFDSIPSQESLLFFQDWIFDEKAMANLKSSFACVFVVWKKIPSRKLFAPPAVVHSQQSQQSLNFLEFFSTLAFPICWLYEQCSSVDG